MIVTKIYYEPMEIPGTDCTAVRCEGHTVVLNENGRIKGILPAENTLFDLAEWCAKHDEAYKQGYADGFFDGYRRLQKRMKKRKARAAKC